jgi:hypothetical protein
MESTRKELKMNKHEMAIFNIGVFRTLFDENNDDMNVAFDELEEYIYSCEAFEKDVLELDVKIMCECLNDLFVGIGGKK